MTELTQVRLLVAGEWQDGAQQADVLDKFHLKPYARAHIASQDQVRAAVAGAKAAFEASTLTGYERGAILDRAAAIIERDGDKFVELLRTEAGFTLSDSQGELRRCIQTFKLSAEEARRLVGEVIPLEGAPQQKGRLGFTIPVPLGVICAITPFNAPINTVAHKVAPAIAAGNAVVVKPSSSTPNATNMIAAALLEAGLPRGLISVIHGGSQVAGWLIAEPAIKFFAFTGSTEVGRDIQQRAGLRRTQMELGSIAFTILASDANLDVALPKVAGAGFRKAGQVCTSIQTLLVHNSIKKEVETRLAKLVAEMPYGDPHDAKTQVGPVINEASARRIDSWIQLAVQRGAGAPPPGGGPRARVPSCRRRCWPMRRSTAT